MATETTAAIKLAWSRGHVVILPIGHVASAKPLQSYRALKNIEQKAKTSCCSLVGCFGNRLGNV